jgi:hypothetical protein
MVGDSSRTSPRGNRASTHLVDIVMDTENINDEQNQSPPTDSLPTKMRMKERSHSQTTPTDTDINDPENLDYEDIDDNHQAKHMNHSAKKSADEETAATDIQVI